MGDNLKKPAQILGNASREQPVDDVVCSTVRCSSPLFANRGGGVLLGELDTLHFRLLQTPLGAIRSRQSKTKNDHAYANLVFKDPLLVICELLFPSDGSVDAPNTISRGSFWQF